MEFYSAIKKSNLAFAKTWMGLESITLSEIVQAEKDKYCMVSYIYGILKTKNKKKPSYKQSCCRGWGKWGEVGKRVKDRIKHSGYK